MQRLMEAYKMALESKRPVSYQIRRTDFEEGHYMTVWLGYNCNEPHERIQQLLQEIERLKEQP